MEAENKRKDKRAYWSVDEQIFFLDGKGWGVNILGDTVCLGKEEDILKKLEEEKELNNGTNAKRSSVHRGRVKGTAKHRSTNTIKAKIGKRFALRKTFRKEKSLLGR